MQLGVPFRRAVLILLSVWTVLFFVSQFLSGTPTIPPTTTPPVCEVKPATTTPATPTTVDVQAPPRPIYEVPFPKELSFILLNWNRTSCLRTIVEHAQRYHPFITEIVIGNNNPYVLLKAEDFSSPKIPLRVLNFPQNRFFYARYELCLMSTGKYCYMQDDDWDNRYLKSLYANFLRFPHLLHTDTNDFVHYLSWSWTFFEPKINLHTGFSWLGTGAISTKENVQRFVSTQASLIPREDMPLADMYFATWFNQVPYQLQNDLFELDKTQTGFSNQKGGINRNKLHITKGIQRLYKMLEEKSPLFPTEEQYPKVEQRHTKSPCSEDDCLFMTNIDSFPNAREIIYEPSLDLEAVENVHRDFFKPDKFLANPYFFAVDNDRESAWISLYTDVSVGDFFGLDLLEPTMVKAIYLKVGHAFWSELYLELSTDGISWSRDTCTWEADNRFSESAYYIVYTSRSGCDCQFRFFRFIALATFPGPFHVYDVAIKDKLEFWVPDEEQTVTKRCANVPPYGPIAQTSSLDKVPTPIREIGNGEIPVTLIILNWRRTHNFPFIFDYLAQFPFVNEYIVWNNNKDKILDMSMLFPKAPPPSWVSVRIINSPQNLHDYAKYLSCSMATNDYCYFQDDDWLNVYFRSQYTSFLRHPHLFHSMTIPIIYLEHRRWAIYNKEVGLHAGFSWLGVGSFTSKKRVQNFLHQCSLFNLNQDELLQADLFFSYFNNDYPVELSTIASQLDQSDAWSGSVDQWGIVYRRLQLSSLKVYNHLKGGNNGTRIPISEPTPAYEDRDVRSPCKRDNCLFVTNSYPFPYPNLVTFDPARTIKEQEKVYNELNWPSNWFWMYNSYDRAVDENIFTAWTSYQVAKRGDYFGLDLLKFESHTKISVILDHDVANYDVRISGDGGKWTTVQYSTEIWHLAGPLRSYSLILPSTPYRLINFALRQASDQIVSLYEITEGDPPALSHFSENMVVNPSFEDSVISRTWFLQHPDQVDVQKMQDELGTIGFKGGRSLVFTSKGGASTYSASQVITLDQRTPRTVVVSVYSKAENVINMDYPAAGYHVAVDLTFEDGTSEWASQTIVFNPGTHGWQPKVIAVKPAKSLKSITVVLVFRNHKGTVFFDEVTVQEEL